MLSLKWDPQYVWYQSHILHLLLGLLFVPLYLFQYTTLCPMVYKASLWCAIMAYAMVIRTQYGPVQFTALYWSRLVVDENIQYVLVALTFALGSTPPLPSGCFNYITIDNTLL
jgi:hypothetical protein